MMDHASYRRAIGADPNDADPLLRLHRESCPECSAYTERLRNFESRLERALRVPVPAGGNVLPLREKEARKSTRPFRWMAIAASVMLGPIVVASAIWLALPQSSLAADVVAHMAGEPQAWHLTDVPVPQSDLDAVLRDSKIRLATEPGIVSYASSCTFRGHQVPHLVVQTRNGPVTVMVLVHEPLSRPKTFDEQGYRGTIVPMPGHGSIAVLMREPEASSADIKSIAAQVSRTIVWTD
jgi:hypothetical protein